MAMGEESSDKAISVAMRVGKVTYDEVKKAVAKLLAELAGPAAYVDEKLTGKGKPTEKAAKPAETPEVKHGEQTLKQLSAHNGGLSTVELKAPHMRQLRRVLKEHNVDFSVVKDGKGAYTLFFKGKDADSITHALKSYTRRVVKRGRGDRTADASISETLTAAKTAAQKREQGRDQNRDKERGQRRGRVIERPTGKGARGR